MQYVVIKQTEDRDGLPMCHGPFDAFDQADNYMRRWAFSDQAYTDDTIAENAFEASVMEGRIDSEEGAYRVVGLRAPCAFGE